MEEERSRLNGLIIEVMTAGEKILPEELELQYDLEHGSNTETQGAAAVDDPLSSPMNSRKLGYRVYSSIYVV